MLVRSRNKVTLLITNFVSIWVSQFKISGIFSFWPHTLLAIPRESFVHNSMTFWNCPSLGWLRQFMLMAIEIAASSTANINSF
jgi:hypothetical protein